MKVSEKGAVSIYGMGRFPVTLYKEHVGRHSRVHFRERGAVEGKGLVEGMKNQTLRQVFFGS